MRDQEPVEIGQRVRIIRRRRGLSLDVAAGLAGISKPYLSMLERGERRWERRGLLEDVAGAIGCSVTDLTGQPYLPVDGPTADALAALPALTAALYDTTLDDAPEVPVRPVHELVRWAAQANAQCAEARFSVAGRDLDVLLTELHVHAATGDADTRGAALAAIVEACVVVFGTSRQLGHPELAIQAARRAQAAADQLGDPALTGFAELARVSGLSRMGARRAAAAALPAAIAAVEPYGDPTGRNVAAAEALGMMHLVSAQLAARERRADEADAHLGQAAELATVTGERNTLQWHFGPANVTAWSLAVAVETERGPGVAELIDANPPQPVSAGRRARLHLDLARGYAQAEGERDAEAIRHLDTADRIAPQRLRLDPIARDLALALDRRAQGPVWELVSLLNRFGLARHG